MTRFTTVAANASNDELLLAANYTSEAPIRAAALGALATRLAEMDLETLNMYADGISHGPGRQAVVNELHGRAAVEYARTKTSFTPVGVTADGGPLTYLMAARGLKPGNVVSHEGAWRTVAALPVRTSPQTVDVAFTDGDSLLISDIHPFDVVIGTEVPVTWPAVITRAHLDDLTRLLRHDDLGGDDLRDITNSVANGEPEYTGAGQGLWEAMTEMVWSLPDVDAHDLENALTRYLGW